MGSRSIDAAEIGLRLDLLEAYCGLWKQGRGRPVDRDALVESGALSDRYLEDVIAITKELSGDSERLIEALRTREDPRLKGFRVNILEQLQEYLARNGYLDYRPSLTESELKLRARTTPAANQLPEGVGQYMSAKVVGMELNVDGLGIVPTVLVAFISLTAYIPEGCEHPGSRFVQINCCQD